MNDQISSIRGLLESPFGAQFDDPAFRQQAQRIDAILNDGQDGGDLTAEGLYEFANRLFSRELQKGVGDRLPDGGVITQKRLVSALEDGPYIVLELDIHARRPDGTEYDYRAPVTKNRTSDDADEVLRIPVQQVRDRLRGASMLAQGLERAGGREAVLAQMRAPQMGLQGMPAEQPEAAMPAPGQQMGLVGPGA